MEWKVPSRPFLRALLHFISCLFLLKIAGTNAEKSALYNLVPQQADLYLSTDLEDEEKPYEMPCFLQLKLNLKNTLQYK